MPVSATEPLRSALERTKLVLFQPFNLAKWFGLGFCAFLALLAENGCYGSVNYSRPAPWPWTAPPPGATTTLPATQPATGPATAPVNPGAAFLSWLAANWAWVVLIGSVAVIAGVALLWLSCRGRFMFIDGIVKNRGAVVEPWQRYAEPANGYFAFSLLLWAIWLMLTALATGAGLLIGWADVAAQEFGTGAIVAFSLAVPIVTILFLVMLIAFALLRDFIVPTMYVRELGVLAAWRAFWHELLPGNVVAILLFYVVRIVLALALAIVTSIVMCGTCCLAAVPYIGTVILLPALVFVQCYTLYFLQQFGAEWFFFRESEAGYCRVCGYDLRGNVSGVCPECGTAIE